MVKYEHIYHVITTMTQCIQLKKNEKLYHLTLDDNFQILKIIDENKELLFDNNSDPRDSLSTILQNAQIADEYLKQKKIHDYLNYFKIPINFHLQASKVALARIAFFDALALILAVVDIPCVSSFMCYHPVLVLLMVSLLAVASVIVREPIFSIGFKN